jgi:hypothetical protein
MNFQGRRVPMKKKRCRQQVANLHWYNSRDRFRFRCRHHFSQDEVEINHEAQRKASMSGSSRRILMGKKNFSSGVSNLHSRETDFDSVVFNHLAETSYLR